MSRISLVGDGVENHNVFAVGDRLFHAGNTVVTSYAQFDGPYRQSLLDKLPEFDRLVRVDIPYDPDDFSGALTRCALDNGLSVQIEWNKEKQ